MQTLLTTTPHNAASPEVDALILKLLRSGEVTQHTVALASRTQLAPNRFYPFLQHLLVGDFEAFRAAAKEALLGSGVEVGELERNIKIQAIPRILSGIKNASYSQVSEILKIEKGEVESYIIEAIQKGLLKAKIDESQETILIKYVSAHLAKSTSAPSGPRTPPPSRRVSQHWPTNSSRSQPSDVYIFNPIRSNPRAHSDTRRMRMILG